MYLIFSRKGWFKKSLFGSWIHFWVVSYSEGSDGLNKYRYHICHDCKYVSSFTSSLTHPSIHSSIHAAIHSSIYPSIFFYLSIHPVTKPSIPSIYPFSLSFIHILFYWLFCFILVHFLYFFPFLQAFMLIMNLLFHDYGASGAMYVWQTIFHSSLYSEDAFHSGCWNISHHQEESFSRLHSHGLTY